MILCLLRIASRTVKFTAQQRWVSAMCTACTSTRVRYYVGVEVRGGSAQVTFNFCFYQFVFWLTKFRICISIFLRLIGRSRITVVFLSLILHQFAQIWIWCPWIYPIHNMLGEWFFWISIFFQHFSIVLYVFFKTLRKNLWIWNCKKKNDHNVWAAAVWRRTDETLLCDFQLR